MARVLVVAKLSAAAAAESFATTKTLAISPSMRYTTKHANPKFDTAGERNNKRNAAGREGRGEEPGRGQAIAPTMDFPLPTFFVNIQLSDVGEHGGGKRRPSYTRA